MEQTQIRQPKMPAAQSFIQISGTFLAKLLIFIAFLFSYIKNSFVDQKTAKTIGSTRFILKKSNFIYQKKKCQREMKLKI